MHEFFGEPIHVYTREQALDDGQLVDVSRIAQEAGFRFPVAVTAAVWADIADIPDSKSGIQDVAGRTWDLLYMAAVACRRGQENASGELLFKLIMHVGRSTYYTAKLDLGPGDEGEPVVTIMGPEES